MKEVIPWVKWYFDRWRNDEGLRMCSLSARGLWIELLAIMHGCDPYGHLVINGLTPTPKQIAVMIGSTRAEVAKNLEELEKNGVLSRCENSGIIYSRRLVRDHAMRTKNRANGQLGGNPALKTVNGEVNPTDQPPAQTPVKAEERRERREEEKKESPSGIPKKVGEPHGSRLPDDWTPGPAEIKFARDLGLDPSAIAAQFRDYWHAKPGKDGRKLDWPGTWRNWCRRTERQPKAGLFRGGPSPTDWIQY